MKSIKEIRRKIANNSLGKSIVLSVMLKPVSMVLGIIYTPILLKYLGDTKYGVWITILSIVNWISNFDIGIGNGLRNCLTGEILNGQYDEANKSVSTAYRLLTTVVFGIYIIVLLGGRFIDWNSIFNTDINVVFSWTKSTNTYNLTATGSGVNISMSGTYTMTGTSTTVT